MLTKRKLLLIILASIIIIGCEKKDEGNYLKGTSTVTDADNNTYKTVIIGHPFLEMDTQEWMAENLRTTRYANGDPIDVALTKEDWQSKSDSHQPYLTWYNYDNQNSDYGAYYNHHVAKDHRGVCPTGWRVPEVSDIETLSIILEGYEKAGGKLKSTTHHWMPPNTNATDIVEFSALPGGYVIYESFFKESISGRFWLLSKQHNYAARAFYVNYDDEILSMEERYVIDGLNIRCIKE